MSKFNSTATKPARGSGPIVAAGPGVTHEGGQGLTHDVRSELFLLAVSNMVGESTFYEKADDRDERFRALVHRVAVTDGPWFAGFVGWLRSEGNMRSASLAAALEGVRARLSVAAKQAEDGIVTRLQSDGVSNRQLVASVLQRADEPGEALAYWTSTYGRAVPKPVKRGVADAVQRLYTEYNLLKYDTTSKGFRFGDVVDLVHPTARAVWQGALFEHALDRRHGRENGVPGSLGVVRANVGWRAAAASGEHVEALLSPAALREAGLTWEDVLSLLGSKVDKAKLWEALAPSMGYMATIRNLRNFDEAGVSDEVAQAVAARLADPDQVAKSRQFPYRFLAAYEQAPSLRWGHALDRALTASLANVPKLAGRTLVLIDTSASMTSGGFSAKSKMSPAKAAAVFGVVLAARCNADLCGFADGVFRHEVPKGASVLREVDRFVSRTGEVGHGTNIAGSLRATWSGHDRVFVISDMQTMDHGTSTAVPDHVALYGFNLGGYRATALDAGKPNRIELGGLTDATFRMVPLIEAGRNAAWPWM